MIGDRKCDSCGRELDPELDATRFRHRDCPVPALSMAALDVIEKINRRAGRGGSSPAAVEEVEG